MKQRFPDACHVDLLDPEMVHSFTLSGSFFDGLRYFIALGLSVARPGMLIHGGDDLYERENFIIIRFKCPRLFLL